MKQIFEAMATTPKVSVIIPNYNHAKYLPKRIETVLEQSYENLEIFILDDCSPDNSRDIINEYEKKDSRIQKVYNIQNSGSTFRQWHKGMELATGKYIWLAESDDYSDPRFLEKLVTILESDDAIGLAYSNSWYVYEDKQIIEQNFDFYKNMDPVLWTKDFISPGIELVKKFMSYRNIIPNASAVVLRNNIVKQVPPPNGNMRLVGDWLYWASILAVSKVAFLSEPLNYFRFHTNNVRSKSDTNGLSMTETLTMLKLIRQYGEPDEYFSKKMINELKTWWLESMVGHGSNFTWKQHYQIYQSIAQLDKSFKKNFTKDLSAFFLSNNFSGLRQLAGDGILYPLIRKISKKDK